jgi:hypothetical protein
MLHGVLSCSGVQRGRWSVTVEIEGVVYRTLAEVLEELQITRQTLWRWRRQGKVIPPGRRFRTGQVLFNEEDAEAIRRYANRIELIESPGSQTQMNLFAPAPARPATQGGAPPHARVTRARETRQPARTSRTRRGHR